MSSRQRLGRQNGVVLGGARALHHHGSPEAGRVAAVIWHLRTVVSFRGPTAALATPAPLEAVFQGDMPRLDPRAAGLGHGGSPRYLKGKEALTS